MVSHDRFFMDRVVDHLLVFKGDGVINDFPGNYSQYREWSALQSKETEKAKDNESKEKKTAASYRNDTRRKLSFKEKREFEQLEKEIASLEAERKTLEEQLCSGTLSVDELTEKSRRLPMLKEELEEKEMRWLELSEFA